jgi:hypothetical protein
MLEQYKDRVIDVTRPVRVYRNLNKKGVVYSVQQKGKVVAYATQLALTNCHCYVNQNGVQRVRKKQVREVHAWIEGMITSVHSPTNARISYNPYKFDFFYNTENAEAVSWASYMRFDQDGVHINKQS